MWKKVQTWIVEVFLTYANPNGGDIEGVGRGGTCIIMDHWWAKVGTTYEIIFDNYAQCLFNIYALNEITKKCVLREHLKLVVLKDYKCMIGGDFNMGKKVKDKILNVEG